MDRQEVISELQRLIRDYLKEQGYELVELIYRYEGGDLFLRILTDRPDGGITVDECSFLNNQIGAVLDERNILNVRYILEVSSPGLDRPLKTKEDFLRCLNRKVRLFLREAFQGKSEIEGHIKGIAGENVAVDTGTEIMEVPLCKINMAKQLI